MKTIDLSKLPPPKIIEELSFEVIFARNKNDLVTAKPELANALELESEPLTKLLQDWSYKELLLRQRINEAVKALLLAHSEKADLDNLVAANNVERLVIQKEDLSATPPVQAIMESDKDLRNRALLAWDGLSTAGPEGAYIFHALSASALVKDVSVQSPELSLVDGQLVSLNGIPPGVIIITVLSREGTGVPTPDLLSTVSVTLNKLDTRPLTDHPVIKPATVTPYQIAATLFMDPGAAGELALMQAEDAVRTYASESHLLARPITRSGIVAALRQPGVIRVELMQPADTGSDILIQNTKESASFCTAISLVDGSNVE